MRVDVRFGGVLLVLVVVGLLAAFVGMVHGHAGQAVRGIMGVLMVMLMCVSVGMLVGVHGAAMGMFVRVCMGVRV
jgi:hypothetical protein